MDFGSSGVVDGGTGVGSGQGGGAKCTRDNKQGQDSSWILSKKSEDFFSDSHFYVFVLLKSLGARPDFFVAPSIEVAKYIYTTHREWLKGSKRDGTQR